MDRTLTETINRVPVVIRLRRHRTMRADERGMAIACRGKVYIYIDPKLPERERLEVLIHELLHAAYWHLDESEVESTARDMERILRKLGVI